MAATMPLPDGTAFPPIKTEEHVQISALSIEPSAQGALSKRGLPEGAEEPDKKRPRLSKSPSDLTGGTDLAALVSRVTSTIERNFNSESENKQSGAGVGSEVLSLQEAEPLHDGRSFNASPLLYMRVLSLPILESLSTQIVSILAQNLFEETALIVKTPNSEIGQAYASLQALFTQAKKIYTDSATYLSADELEIYEPEHRAAIRLSNLATFISAVYEGRANYFELHDHFVEILTPDGEPLEQGPAKLFLDLKTQLYLMATTEPSQERSKEELLEEFFPVGLHELLASRHPESILSQSEFEFTEAARQRRELFMRESVNPDNLQRLSEKYAWGVFLQDISSYLMHTYGTVIAPYMERHDLAAPVAPTSLMLQGSGNHQQVVPPEDVPAKSIEDDVSAQAALAVQAALQSAGYHYQPLHNGTNHTSTPLHSINNALQSPPQQTYQLQAPNVTHHPQHQVNGVPWPSQSAPTQVLYERARQAAAAKSNPTHARREGSPSQRRPWTNAEENALMAGLDQVKGPHWSQILALYGRTGTISNILKDRNQVQLKDKARNLKLFFLKSGIEVPYYLTNVTGCLKTRAPTQAARKEAEARARVSNDDSQARFNSIITLASNFQGAGEVAPQAQNQVQAPNQFIQSPLRGSSSDSAGTLASTNPKVESPEAQADEELREQLLLANSAPEVVS